MLNFQRGYVFLLCVRSKNTTNLTTFSSSNSALPTSPKGPSRSFLKDPFLFFFPVPPWKRWKEAFQPLKNPSKKLVQKVGDFVTSCWPWTFLDISLTTIGNWSYKLSQDDSFRLSFGNARFFWVPTNNVFFSLVMEFLFSHLS